VNPSHPSFYCSVLNYYSLADSTGSVVCELSPAHSYIPGRSPPRYYNFVSSSCSIRRPDSRSRHAMNLVAESVIQTWEEERKSFKHNPKCISTSLEKRVEYVYPHLAHSQKISSMPHTRLHSMIIRQMWRFICTSNIAEFVSLEVSSLLAYVIFHTASHFI
jgi:hypothetical protein